MYQRGQEPKDYGPIPEATEFWTGFGWEIPAKVEGWDWSVTFGKWTAYVTLQNGHKTWTFPKTWSDPLVDKDGFLIIEYGVDSKGCGFVLTDDEFGLLREYYK